MACGIAKMGRMGVENAQSWRGRGVGHCYCQCVELLTVEFWAYVAFTTPEGYATLLGRTTVPVKVAGEPMSMHCWTSCCCATLSRSMSCCITPAAGPLLLTQPMQTLNSLWYVCCLSALLIVLTEGQAKVPVSQGIHLPVTSGGPRLLTLQACAHTDADGSDGQVPKMSL